MLCIHPKNQATHAVPEIPESRFIVFAFKLRFVPACASLNRGFLGLHAWRRQCHRVRLYRGKPILQIFYPYTNASIRKQSNASSCRRVRVYFCKPILQIFYPYTNASIRKQSNASSCHRLRLYFCKRILQIFYLYTNASIQSPKSPNPDLSFGHPNGVSIRKQSNASSCHRVRLYFCAPILQIFYKEPNAPIRKRNASSCHRVRLYFCTHILQIFYLYTNASIRKKKRIVVSSRAFVFLYTHLAKILPLYKRIHPKKATSSSCHRVRLYFCTHILQIFYLYTNASIRKNNTSSSSCHRRVIVVSSSCHRVRVYFCKRILQRFNKDTNASIRKNNASSSGQHATTKCAMSTKHRNVSTRLLSKSTSHIQ